MRTALGVQARIGQPQTLHRATVQQVLLDNLAHVADTDKAVPDGVGIDHHDRAMLALVQTSQFIGADLALQSGFFDGVLECALQLGAALIGAAWPGGALIAFVDAKQEVVLELRHAEAFLPA